MSFNSRSPYSAEEFGCGFAAMVVVCLRLNLGVNPRLSLLFGTMVRHLRNIRNTVAVASIPMLLALASGTARAQTSEWTTKQPLPKPTGRYAIGTVSFRMIDTVFFSDGGRLARPVTAQAWYPAIWLACRSTWALGKSLAT